MLFYGLRFIELRYFLVYNGNSLQARLTIYKPDYMMTHNRIRISGYLSNRVWTCPGLFESALTYARLINAHK